MQRTLLTRLAAGGVIIALAALATLLTGAGAQVAHTFRVLGRLRPEAVSLALALSILSALLSGVVWWRLIPRLGYRAPFRAALTAYVCAGLGGYVVNAAGPILGCAVSLRKYGVCPGRAALLTLTANALGFCGVLVWTPVGLLLLSRTGMDRALPILGRHGPLAATLLVVTLAVAMLLVLRALAGASGSRQRLARSLLGRLPALAEGPTPAVRCRHLLMIVPWSAGSWLAGALPLYVLLAAMHPRGDFTLGDVIGSAVLATALGSLAFFVPEGVGVSDGALVALLTHATGIPVATCAAAAIALRALDPLTKLSLLCVLALTAHPLAARPAQVAARPARSLRCWLAAHLAPHPTPPHPTLLRPLWRAATEDTPPGEA
ncbi:MAG TPA: lysylphosphatidylglycerol synthase domain-containing protein [Chloroflexota bacterium]|nr:lysylphosphatidylglycerol synthase domain-containing protein [Chloroflexota bacterium]